MTRVAHTFGNTLHGLATVAIAHDHIPLGQIGLRRDGGLASRADDGAEKVGVDC